jgi:long-chain fatty acid transport protein
MKRAVVILVMILLAPAAFAAGFQIAAQGARAMGMGGAYTAVAEDATAIWYNPAGLTQHRDGEFVFGSMWATKTDFSFTPNGGATQDGRSGNDILPQVYLSQPFGGRYVAGIGVNTPFGLPVKWEPSFTGRSIAYTSLLRTINVNPTVAMAVTPNFSIGFGADYMFSKVQLQRSLWFGGPEAQTKLKNELFDDHGWGWNAGLMWTSGDWRLGATYRSSIDVDHDVTVTAFSSGNAAIDAAVARGTGPATVKIEYPSSLNLGVAYVRGNMTFSVDLDRTDWSSFDQLQVLRGTTALLSRNTNWDDSWAWRFGFRKESGPLTWRLGFYRDQTPQPSADVGPILPDADRNGYSIGISLGAPGGIWPSVDIADIYVKFSDRNGPAVPTVLPTLTTAGALGLAAGTYATTGNELALNLHWNW